jgi:2-methylisocitrate lyase-like PEP mutase family enzyme
MANAINGMAELFRARLARPETIALPGCYDVVSALISEDAGFEAIFLSGYGNEENVSRTIYEVESAGVAAIQMEDQISPKRCGHAEGKKVLPVELYLSKLTVALKARQTPLSIIARTDSTDLDDAVRQWMPALRRGRDLKAIADASLQFDEFQQFIEKSYRERKYLR